MALEFPNTEMKTSSTTKNLGVEPQWLVDFPFLHMIDIWQGRGFDQSPSCIPRIPTLWDEAAIFSWVLWANG